MTNKGLIKLENILLVLFSLSLHNGYSQKNIPSVQEVANYIVEKEIKHPEVVLRQAIMESGWFKCDIATKKNNLFGFRGSGPYFTFSSWKESVDFYKKWQEKNYRNHKEDYYDFLFRIRYAGSKNYCRELQKIQLKNISFNQ